MSSRGRGRSYRGGVPRDQALWLACGRCNRNLAAVFDDPQRSQHPARTLVLHDRPNTPGHTVHGPGAAPTWTLPCRCGASHQVRYDRLAALLDTDRGGTVYLGRDL